jgi:hypothetical protein
MPTVTISAAVDKMMKAMFAETMEACVAKLSEKYGFDEKEALEFLEIDGLKEKKEEKKKEWSKGKEGRKKEGKEGEKREKGG